MVRVNLISPKLLSDQHLIAEYNELLMLRGYIKKYPKLTEIPKNYCLGKGHMMFFKNKAGYLKQRHEQIKMEMKKRGFATRVNFNISQLPKNLIKNWKPKHGDLNIIKARIIWKINNKPNYYRYYGEKKSKNFFLDLLKDKV